MSGTLQQTMATATHEDPLDSPLFDPIHYINQKFPSEAALDDVDTFVVAIGSKITALDDEISKAVQAQSRAGEQATRDITDAQVAIRELFDKIGDIKSKASQSERMVQEICADIKKLDCAKNHLQSTITSLKRLQMLMTAVGQLELMTTEFQYREVSNLLDAVRQLMSHFERYTSIPKIAAIKRRVDVIQTTLKRHVHASFREIGQIVDSVADAESLTDTLPGNMHSLSDACSVVDALGPMARKDLMDEFVQLQLLPYEKIFSPGKSHFGLDHVDRRWAWIKRLVRTIDEKFKSICPKHWRLSQRLCLSFNERTKAHMHAMLSEFGDGSDVSQLLKALQSTLRYEQEMRSRFEEDMRAEKTALEQGYCSPFVREKDPQTYHAERSAVRGRSGPLPNATAPVIYLPEDPDVIVTEEERSYLSRLLEPNCISNVFEEYLGPYVLLERRNLEEMLDRLRQEEGVTTEGTDGSACTGSVYGSSISMFVYVKNSIKRCTALTSGPTFLSLSKEFRTCLQNYAESLRNKCPTAVGQPPVYKLPQGSEVSLCHTINTAEYCSEVVGQLEGIIKSKMNSEELANGVDFSNETDVFQDVLAYALNVLHLGIMDRLEPAFRAMQNVNWAGVNMVGEESAYIHQWQSILQDMLPRIRDALSEAYFRSLCTKLATSILQRYLDIIFGQKRISETGTQQLLLDTYNVKTLLLHLHHLGLAADSDKRAPVPSMYMKLVTTRTAHIEVVLKLIGTPTEMLLERFKIMWPDGTAADLQIIMSLQGMTRQQQQQSLEMYGLAVPAGGPASQPHGGTTNGHHAGGTTRDPRVSVSGGAGSAAATATVTSMASSMRSLTQDLSSSTRSAMSDLRKAVLR